MMSEGVDLYRVLAFCAWPQRAAVAAVSPEVRQKLGHRAVHWRFLCERLAAEHNVYVPCPMPGQPDLPPPGIADSWQSLFTELFRVRHRFAGKALEERNDQRLAINVAARFRPAHDAPGTIDEDEEDQHGVVLPFHQKVQIVCDRLGCSKTEAKRIVIRERGRKSLDCPFEDSEAKHRAPDASPVPSDTEEATDVEVAVSGPLPDDELVYEADDRITEDTDRQGEAKIDKTIVAAGDVETQDVYASILAVREDTGSILAVAPGIGLREFDFDRVFSDKSKQADTYDYSAQRLVMDFLNGINTSIICYGQTGSGKTYTMFGPSGRKAQEHCQGIVPRACLEVISSMRERRAQGVDMELGLSYVEVFGSEVSDLLKFGQVVGQGQEGRYANVRATDRVGHRYVLDGRTECVVESWEEVQELLDAGDQAKRRAATAMNERSTRAHTLLVLTLTQRVQPGVEVRSRLFLADLGGSEKISKSKADEGTVAPVLMVGGVEVHRVGWAEYYLHRQRIQETLQINKGLFALKKVIDALHQRQQMLDQGVPSANLPRVPYQDSKLTMLLKDALGGASRTLVFCTAAMDSKHATESLQTLRFGERCAQVQQRPKSDKAASVQAALRHLEQQISDLEAEIVRKERWEMRVIKRRDIDTIAGSFGDPTFERTEMFTTAVLVGAEKEREELEELLQRQMDLQGLGGFADKDYRDMKAKEAKDGGKGLDFRAKAQFHARVKAKDFESEDVIASALRYFFRQTKSAEQLFGETEASRAKRSALLKLHDNYYVLAQHLKTVYEEKVEAGTEQRSLGKSILDLTQEWRQKFKEAPELRELELGRLVRQVPELAKLAQVQSRVANSGGGSGYPGASSSVAPVSPLTVTVSA